MTVFVYIQKPGGRVVRHTVTIDQSAPGWFKFADLEPGDTYLGMMPETVEQLAERTGLGGMIERMERMREMFE